MTTKSLERWSKSRSLKHIRTFSKDGGGLGSFSTDNKFRPFLKLDFVHFESETESEKSSLSLLSRELWSLLNRDQRCVSKVSSDSCSSGSLSCSSDRHGWKTSPKMMKKVKIVFPPLGIIPANCWMPTWTIKYFRSSFSTKQIKMFFKSAHFSDLLTFFCQITSSFNDTFPMSNLFVQKFRGWENVNKKVRWFPLESNTNNWSFSILLVGEKEGD